jgi:hypothetical protein
MKSCILQADAQHKKRNGNERDGRDRPQELKQRTGSDFEPGHQRERDAGSNTDSRCNQQAWQP